MKPNNTKKLVYSALFLALALVLAAGGTVNLLLANGGAEVLYTTNSGKLITDRVYDRKGDLYVFDEGASNIIVETSSGNLKIQ